VCIINQQCCFRDIGTTRFQFVLSDMVSDRENQTQLRKDLEMKKIIFVLTILAMVSGSSAQLAGRWAIVECNVGTIYGAQGDNGATINLDKFMFRSEEDKCVAVGFPKEMELLRDGTGIIDNDSKTWKTQNNRIYFMGSPAKAFNYRLSGSMLTLSNDNKNEAMYVEPSAVKKTKEARETAANKATRSGTITDKRNGQTYKTVKIGNQTWMAENLNYATGNSWCYGEGGKVEVEGTNFGQGFVLVTLTGIQIEANCNKYGRLYDWTTAKTACPVGWHLPTQHEWEGVIRTVKRTHDYGYSTLNGNVVGKALKSTSGWNENGNGTDAFGFSALPGGYRRPSGIFYNAGREGRWWPSDKSNVGVEYMNYSNDAFSLLIELDTSQGVSVRCVADE